MNKPVILTANPNVIGCMGSGVGAAMAAFVAFPCAAPMILV